MALIDLALLESGKVFVDTTTNPSETDLIGVGALTAPTTVYHGNGDIDLTTIVGINALSNNNIVATGGADVSIGAGLLDVSLLTGQNLLVDGDSSITMDAAGISVAGVLTDLLNKTTVAFSGGGAGTFQFNPPAIGLLSTFTIDVEEMEAGDKIVIPYDGNGPFELREPTNILGQFTGYDASTGYLTLTNGTALFSAVNVRIKMTQAEYDEYAANRGDFLDGTNDTFTFPGTVDPDDPDYVVPCFAAGTMIMTQRGEVAIEALSVGDLVRTRDNGLQPIRWIGSKKLSATVLADNDKLRPVRIRAGALGDGLPAADLLVSPQHRVLVRSKIAQRLFGTMEVLVPAKQLLQLDGIDIAMDMAEVEYFHILFDQHEVVLSNGAETESLYTGAQALKAVGPAAREEIFALFPELRDTDAAPLAARALLTGRQARKLAVRHAQNRRDLVC